MSSIHIKYGIAAAAILIALIGFGAAQISTTTAEMAKHPIVTGTTVTPAAARVERSLPNAVIEAMPVTSDGSAGGSLVPSENSYDFNNPDGIPGFGTLPPNYNSAPVMPRMGSE